MDEGMLSQDEIDALLKVGEDNNSEDNEDELSVNDYLTDIEADTLGEIGNISIGSSATTLSTLLNEKVKITTPTIDVIKKSEVMKQFPYEHVSVQVNYLEGFIGESMFVLKSEDAAIIADIMLGNDGSDPVEELTDIHVSAVQEVMNLMMGAAATSMSTIFEKRVNISPPSIELVDETGEPDVTKDIEEDVFVKVSFQLVVGDLIDSQIMQIIPFPFANELVDELMNVEKSSDSTEDKLEEEVVIREEVAAQEEIAATTLADEQASMSEQEQMPLKEEPDIGEKGQKKLNMLLDIH